MVRAPLLVAGIVLCACGARTGLLFEVSERDADVSDAGTDAGLDAGLDAGRSCEVAPVAPPVVTDDPLSSIWIANSVEGTVSKLDTRTGAELGRYRTGDTLSTEPSRTSVDLSGAVYVGNRVFDASVACSVVKIAGRLEDCVDANGDGTIETSTDAVALPWSTDECVLWSSPVGDPGCIVRAVAVDVTEDPVLGLRTVVYAGCFVTHRIYRLDAETGEVLDDFDTGHVTPYGFAVTAQGSMFVASGVDDEILPHSVGIVDLLRSPPVVQQVPLPICDGLHIDGYVSYGIAADRSGRLWTCNLYGCLHRFDPASRTWATVRSEACRGVAIASDGTVWTGRDSALEQWEPETMQLLRTVPTSGLGGIGVALDFDGKVWFVNQFTNDATRVDPVTGVEEDRFPVGVGPYTYSDMTGLQLRTNLGVFWQFSHVFELCDEAAAWLAVDLVADLTLGSGVRVRMRGAPSEAELPAAPFVDAEGIWDPDVPTTGVPAELAAAHYLEVELTAARGADGRWPTLRSVRARVR